MKKYHVVVSVEVDVEAETKEEAEAKGLEEAETWLDLSRTFAECFYAKASEVEDDEDEAVCHS